MSNKKKNLKYLGLDNTSSPKFRQRNKKQVAMTKQKLPQSDKECPPKHDHEFSKLIKNPNKNW